MNYPSVIAELLRYGAKVNVKDQVSNCSLFLPEVYSSLVHLKWQNLTTFCSSKVNSPAGSGGVISINLDTQYMLIQTNFSKSPKQLTYKPL